MRDRDSTASRDAAGNKRPIIIVSWFIILFAIRMYPSVVDISGIWISEL
jgi:hypothetical protein